MIAITTSSSTRVKPRPQARCMIPNAEDYRVGGVLEDGRSWSGSLAGLDSDRSRWAIAGGACYGSGREPGSAAGSAASGASDAEIFDAGVGQRSFDEVQLFQHRGKSTRYARPESEILVRFRFSFFRL